MGGAVQTGTAETDHAHLREGERITAEELGVHASAAAVWLRQLARAAETPAEAVELADLISSLREHAARLGKLGEEFTRVARIVAGDEPVAVLFPSGESWGAAAAGVELAAGKRPALVPTVRQLVWLADLVAEPELDAPEWKLARQQELARTTYAAAMAGLPNLDSFESTAGAARRRAERERAIAREVLVLECATCSAADGKHCRTKSGRLADTAHLGRQRAAEALVDERLAAAGQGV